MVEILVISKEYAMSNDNIQEINDGSLVYPNSGDDVDFMPTNPELAAFFKPLEDSDLEISNEELEAAALSSAVEASIEQPHIAGTVYINESEIDSDGSPESLTIHGEESVAEITERPTGGPGDEVRNEHSKTEEELLAEEIERMKNDPQLMEDFFEYAKANLLTPSQQQALENGEHPELDTEQYQRLNQEFESRLSQALAQQREELNRSLVNSSPMQFGSGTSNNRQVVGDSPENIAKSVGTAVNSLVGAGAAVLGATARVATSAVEAGTDIVNKYLELKEAKQAQTSQIEIPENAEVKIAADPAISTLDMRAGILKEAQHDYGAAIADFWQEPAMSSVKDKIKDLAKERGLSEQDVMAHINSGDPSFKDISDEFNSAYKSSPKAQAAKEKMDSALDDWQHSHERMNHSAARLSPNHKQKQDDTFDLLADSEKDMIKNSAQMPKTEDEPQSNLEKIKEQLERIKEAIKAVIQSVKNMFGKGNSNDTSDAPQPN